jgi:hypothetical protein
MAFCDELKMVISGWMRAGNTSDSAMMESFIDHVLSIVDSKKIGLIRMDSGFYDHKIMHELEDLYVDYIIRAKMTSALMSRILNTPKWHYNNTVFKHAMYTEFTYEGKGWLKGRRMVVVARPKSDAELKNEKGIITIFKQDELHRNYEFTAYVTSSALSASKVHALYNQRADAENRIKELKYDFGLDGFAMKKMSATEAAFRLVLLSYNVMALFKQKVMTSPTKPMLSTLRFQCIAIGSYLVKDGRKKIMKLAAEGKRRHFLEYFFDQIEELSPPFNFSNA